MVHGYQDAAGGPRLGIVAKRAYRGLARGALRPSSIPCAIRTVPEYDSDGPAAELLGDSDLMALLKPATDVILRGHAYSYGRSVRELDTALGVGAGHKRVRVVGDRWVERRGDLLAFTDPAPFDRMPITWRRAFGGRDTAAEAARDRSAARFGPRRGDLATGALTYPRNAAGVGFLVGGGEGRLVGTHLPNLEDPDDPIRVEAMQVDDLLCWGACPVAAGYGPIDPFTFPRAAFLLPPQRKPGGRQLHEVAVGALGAADLEDRPFDAAPNTRLYNCAATGLGLHRLNGGERVKMWNLHPESSLVEFALPVERPTLLLQPPGCPVIVIEAQLSTVELAPDDDTVTLTWAGSTPVAAPFPEDITRAMQHAARWS